VGGAHGEGNRKAKDKLRGPKAAESTGAIRCRIANGWRGWRGGDDDGGVVDEAGGSGSLAFLTMSQTTAWKRVKDYSDII
jgi:hypothetical protein